MAKIRVMLVDDSPVFLGALSAAIEKDPTLTVVGKAMNGQDALDAVPSLKPDVIICDVQMPKMSGIEFLKKLLPEHPLPVVVISSTPGVTLSALQNGAVDFIPKPATGETRDEFFQRVVSTIKTAAVANIAAKMAVKAPAAPRRDVALNLVAPSDVVIAIGASTGGTDAILAVVRNMPANSPPVLITQHMPAGFTAMYAERLNKECKMQVKEARDGQRVERGLILLAAGEHQMRLRKDSNGYYVSSKRGDKVNGHIPSVTVLFDSVAQIAKNRAIGVILTGMGADGADGLLRLRQVGAYTIGQDKATCVVYGMPMAAYNMGAVVRQFPLNQITGELIRHLNSMW